MIMKTLLKGESIHHTLELESEKRKKIEKKVKKGKMKKKIKIKIKEKGRGGRKENTDMTTEKERILVYEPI